MEIPFPGLGVDGLSHRSQQAQRLTRCSANRSLTLSHQRADGCRGGIKNRYIMRVTHLPETRRIGIGWHAFEHHRRRAIRERTIDDIGVPCDPTNISRAPVNVVFFQIEDIFVGHGRPDEIATRRVKDAFGLSCRAAGVENEKRIFRLHRLWRAIVGDCLYGFIQPDITASCHVHLTACVAYG